MVMAHGHCIQIARRKLAWLSSLLIGLSQKQQLPSTTPTPGAVGFPIRFGGVSYTIRILMYRDVS